MALNNSVARHSDMVLSSVIAADSRVFLCGLHNQMLSLLSVSRCSNRLVSFSIFSNNEIEYWFEKQITQQTFEDKIDNYLLIYIGCGIMVSTSTVQ